MTRVARPAPGSPVASLACPHEPIVAGRGPVLAALALVAGSLGLAAASLLVLPAALAFDPFAWAVWGRQVADLALDTSSVPSWKPGPVLATAPLAALGAPADAGWLLVGRAGGLLALAGAGVLAGRLAGPAAGPGAAGLLALSPWWLENSALGNSEGLLAAALLWAAVAHLAGHRRAALALLVGAALVRPEAWPLLGLYGLWLAREERERWPLVGGALALVALLWIVPDLWGSGELLRSSHTARGRPSPGSAGLAPVPALQVLRDAVGLAGAATAALAAAAMGLALHGRDRRVVWIGAAALGWVAIVAIMAQSGYAGRPRYSAPAAAAGCVLAAVALARIVDVVGRGAAGPSATVPVRTAAAATLGTLLLAVTALARAPELADTVADVRYRGEVQADVSKALVLAGGREVLVGCGQLAAYGGLQTILAWELGVPVSATHPVPRAPGAVIRLTGRDGRARPPLDPELARTLETVARSGPVEVRAACVRPPDPSPG